MSGPEKINWDFPQLCRRPSRLAIKLSEKGERSVRNGHPWIFSNSIEKINIEGQSGDLAVIFSRKSNNVIGIGLYDPESPISIKMLHRGGPLIIDEAFFRTAIQTAFDIRKPLLRTDTNAFRLIFGENDGLGGFIADIYDKVLVIKLYSAIWLPYLKLMTDLLVEIIRVDAAVLRLSRNLQNTFSIGDGTLLFGSLKSENVIFSEHGVNFTANVLKGHKTGYFLDHRHNRKRIGELSLGKTVLDVFAYAGGFSVHALAGGAKTVTSVDISRHALDLARENAGLNAHKGEHKLFVTDAFEALKELTNRGERYDIVVIDPPSFAKRESEKSRALNKYRELARLGVQLTSAGGLLLLASCSSRVDSESFFGICDEVLEASRRAYRIDLRTAHDIDHPIGFDEGAYLKSVYYRFLD